MATGGSAARTLTAGPPCRKRRSLYRRLRWTERSLSAILQQLVALEAELDVIVQSPPPLAAEERALADAIRAQLDALKLEGGVVQAQLARIRQARRDAGAPGGPTPDDLPLAV